NLLKPGRGEFIPGKYTDNGKWMDGWESRRRRNSEHDICLIRLGLAGVIRGVDVDTNHFLGNAPKSCRIEACRVEGYAPVATLLSPDVT
ncbi:allantoicase, partial [Acinetobacter baumannii]